jgi:hypothetical protein
VHDIGVAAELWMMMTEISDSALAVFMRQVLKAHWHISNVTMSSGSYFEAPRTGSRKSTLATNPEMNGLRKRTRLIRVVYWR